MTDRPEHIAVPLDDQDLLDTLRATLREIDAVPDHLIEAARASYTWRTIDAELAELVADTAVEAAAVRSAPGLLAPRLLTFTVGATTIVMEATDEDEVPNGPRTHRLQGQLVPARSARLEVRYATGVLPVTVDEYGHFDVPGVPAGPVSLRIEPADGSPVVTSWVAL